MLTIPFPNKQASHLKKGEVRVHPSTTFPRLSALLTIVLLLSASPVGRADLLDGCSVTGPSTEMVPTYREVATTSTCMAALPLPTGSTGKL
jgi:hypothetical protein